MQRAPSCTNAVFSRSSSKFTPISIPGFQCVGYVKSAHGIRGEIFVRLFAEQADWLDQVQSLHLLIPGESALHSHKIESCRPHKEGLIVRLANCPDRNAAEILRRQTVYIPETTLEANPGERIYLKQILGFAVIDPEGAVVGEIRGFATNGVQDLLRVHAEGSEREVLIPFVDAFLIGIDFEKRQVKMDLPPGLLEIEDS